MRWIFTLLMASLLFCLEKDICCWKKISAESPEAQKFLNLYNEVINSAFNKEEKKLKRLSESKVYPKEVPEYLRYYFACLSSFYLGAINEKREELLKKYLERAKKLCERSVELNPNFSDSRRLLADIYGWMINIRWYLALFYGPSADTQLKNAYTLNEENPMVMLAIGRNLLYAPAIFGGDEEKAQEWFLKAYKTCPTCPEVKYWVAEYFYETKKFKKLCKFYQNNKKNFKFPKKIREVCKK